MFYFRVYENAVLSTQDFVQWKKQVNHLIKPYVNKFFNNFEREFHKKYYVNF